MRRRGACKTYTPKPTRKCTLVLTHQVLNQSSHAPPKKRLRTPSIQKRCHARPVLARRAGACPIRALRSCKRSALAALFMMLYACSQQDASTPAPPGAHGPTRMRAAAGPATAVAAQRPDGALGTHSIATKVIYFTTWRRRPAPLRAMRESLAHPHSYPNTPDARCQKPCQHRACMDHSPRSGSHAPAHLRSSPARRPHTRSSNLLMTPKPAPHRAPVHAAGEAVRGCTQVVLSALPQRPGATPGGGGNTGWKRAAVGPTHAKARAGTKTPPCCGPRSPKDQEAPASARSPPSEPSVK